MVMVRLHVISFKAKGGNILTQKIIDSAKHYLNYTFSLLQPKILQYGSSQMLLGDL